MTPKKNAPLGSELRWRALEATVEPSWLGKYGNLVAALTLLPERQPDIAALWLHGSRAIGTHHQYSDLDVTILSQDSWSVEKITDVLADYCQCDRDFPDYFGEAPLPYWFTEIGEVGVHSLSVTELAARITCLKGSPDGLEAHQAFAQHSILHGRPLHDPAKLLRDAQNQCQTVSASLFDALVKKYLRRLEQKIRWWDIRPIWKNDYERLSDIGVIFEEIVRCHYAKNRAFFMEGMKEYHIDRLAFDPWLGDCVDKLLQLTADTSYELTRTKVREVVERLHCMLAPPSQSKESR